MKAALRALLILTAIPGAAALGNDPLLASLKGLKGVTVSLGDEIAKPSVRLHFAEIKMERAQLGFLRVGLVRRPVIRAMEIRIASSGAPWAADLWTFVQAEDWLSGATIRGLKIFGPRGEPVAEAKEAGFRRDSACLDLHGVTLRLGAKTICSETARVALNGADCGRLRLPDGEPGLIELNDSAVFNESAPRNTD